MRNSLLDELDLERLRLAAEERDTAEHGDPNLVFFVHLPREDPVQSTALLAALAALPSVEYAHFQPIPADAQAADIPPTTTIDVRPAQGYLRRAPAGIDWDLARRLAGGDGAGVRIADIEAGWIDGHEDLPPFAFGLGVNWGIFDGDHGTAVLGQIAAGVNGFGADGIAPGATIGWSGVTNLLPAGGLTPFYSVGNALLMAAKVLRPGDIALIEQHYPTLAGACPNTCNCAQFGFVAVESYPYEHAIIRLLTAAGIVVVEAAGNGQQRVVPANPMDSGAIVVGASANNRMPVCFTNFGPRVDVHAWGNFNSIGSLGYGDVPAGAPPGTPPLRANGADRRQWYTTTFAGTSSAAPIVTGAAALIQSIRRAEGLPALDPLPLRALLLRTGTPQAGGAVAIGPQPDLAAAIASFMGDRASFVGRSALPARVEPGAAIPFTAQFRNTGGRRWAGGHQVEIAPSPQSGRQEFSGPAAPAGTAASPLLPGDAPTASLTARAPTQPGTYDLVVRLRAPDGTVLASSPQSTITVAPANQPISNAVLTIVSAPGSLVSGGTGEVVVRAENNGQTTWAPPLALVVRIGGRTFAPVSAVPLPASVAPGGQQEFRFLIGCNSPGRGFFEVRLGGFGASAGRVVVCQPR